jgi:hypothetical protein
MFRETSSGRSSRFSPFPKSLDRLWGPHNLLFKDSEFFRGGKRPATEDKLLPPSTAEVKNDWSYTAGPLYTFMSRTGKTSALATGISAHGMASKSRLIDWLMNGKLQSRKKQHLWANSVTIPAFFWRDWENPRKSSVRINCVTAKLRTA